jgi:hypothetical protein
MTTSRAFDLALFVGVPANLNDASVVSVTGPPFSTAFKSVALSSKPGGVTVQADVPQANAQGQIMLSGAGPNYAWGLATNPAAAASVPPPQARFDIIMADSVPSWQVSSVSAIMTLGGAVTITGGGTFVQAANLVFTPTGAPSRRLDGGDPNFSLLDNFTLDAGTF